MDYLELREQIERWLDPNYEFHQAMLFKILHDMACAPPASAHSATIKD